MVQSDAEQRSDSLGRISDAAVVLLAERGYCRLSPQVTDSAGGLLLLKAALADPLEPIRTCALEEPPSKRAGRLRLYGHKGDGLWIEVAVRTRIKPEGDWG